MTQSVYISMRLVGCISVEDLLNTIERVTVDDQGWVDYLKVRYGWDMAD